MKVKTALARATDLMFGDRSARRDTNTMRQLTGARDIIKDELQYPEAVWLAAGN